MAKVFGLKPSKSTLRALGATLLGPEDWRCGECAGTGKAVPDCEACGGNGWVDDPDDGGTMTCPECLGDKCEACGGSGEKPVAVTAGERDT